MKDRDTSYDVVFDMGKLIGGLELVKWRMEKRGSVFYRVCDEDSIRYPRVESLMWEARGG
jgi:hypothetical protein